MRKRLVALVVMALGLALVPAPSLGDTARVRATGSPGSFEWTPDFRHITKGDRIVWKNTTDSRHTVTAYSPNWSKNTSLPPGERTAKKFRRTGTYKFRCMVTGHSSLDSSGNCTGMCGEIHVTR